MLQGADLWSDGHAEVPCRWRSGAASEPYLYKVVRFDMQN